VKKEKKLTCHHLKKTGPPHPKRKNSSPRKGKRKKDQPVLPANQLEEKSHLTGGGLFCIVSRSKQSPVPEGKKKEGGKGVSSGDRKEASDPFL